MIRWRQHTDEETHGLRSTEFPRESSLEIAVEANRRAALAITFLVPHERTPGTAPIEPLSKQLNRTCRLGVLPVARPLVIRSAHYFPCELPHTVTATFADSELFEFEFLSVPLHCGTVYSLAA